MSTSFFQFNIHTGLHIFLHVYYVAYFREKKVIFSFIKHYLRLPSLMLLRRRILQYNSSGTSHCRQLHSLCPFTWSPSISGAFIRSLNRVKSTMWISSLAMTSSPNDGQGAFFSVSLALTIFSIGIGYPVSCIVSHVARGGSPSS